MTRKKPQEMDNADLDLEEVLGKRIVDLLALGLVLHGGLGVALPERSAVWVQFAIQPCFPFRIGSK